MINQLDVVLEMKINLEQINIIIAHCMQSISIPKHYVIKKGVLIPHMHMNQISDMNFRSIPYLHTIRFLYGDKVYNSMRQLQMKCEQLQNQIETIKLFQQQEINQLKQQIQYQWGFIKQQFTEIQKLRKYSDISIPLSQRKKQMQTLASSQIQFIQIFNSKYQNIPSTKESYLSDSYCIYNASETSDFSEKLLKRIQNSQNILDQMLFSIQTVIQSMAKPNLVKQSLRVKTENLDKNNINSNYINQRLKSQQQQVFSQESKLFQEDIDKQIGSNRIKHHTQNPEQSRIRINFHEQSHQQKLNYLKKIQILKLENKKILLKQILKPSSEELKLDKNNND